MLTQSGRLMHKCAGKLAIIGPDNGLSPRRCRAIIWTNDRLLLIGHLGRNLSEILIIIHAFSFKKMHLKMSSAKWRALYLGLIHGSINHAIIDLDNRPFVAKTHLWTNADLSSSTTSSTTVVVWTSINVTGNTQYIHSFHSNLFKNMHISCLSARKPILLCNDISLCIAFGSA